MADNTNEALESFQDTVKGLRKSNDFGTLLDDIKDKLGLPDDTCRVEIKALLIKAVIDCYGTTLKADMALAALGLLEGFDNRDENTNFPDGGALLTERRIKFLKESTYIPIKSKGKYKSYEDAAKDKATSASEKTPLETIENTLGASDGRYLGEAAQRLFNKSDINRYLEVAKKEYTKECRLPGGKTVLKIKLPPFANPDNSRPGMSAKGEPEAKDQTSGESSTSSGEPEEIKDKPYTYNEATAVAQVSNNNSVTVQVNVTNTRQQAESCKLPPVTKIFVSENSVSMEPGETYEIGASVLPNSAKGSPLSYVSLDTDIITVSTDGLITAKNKSGTTKIIIQAESGVTAAVCVSVQDKPDNGEVPPPVPKTAPEKPGRPLNTYTSFAGGGPQRPTYTMAKPADHATFNSITDNAAVGDERDFVRIAEAGSGRTFTSELIVEPGKEYEVWIYYHNDASETFNDSAHNYVGVARQTRMNSHFPNALAKGERQKVEAYITSTTTNPRTIWDEAYITAKEALTIEYVEGSAHIYNKWDVNGMELGAGLFTPNGVYLGVNKLDGLVLGGNLCSGTVIYRIRTAAMK